MSATTTTLPYTGREFLDSLDDGREVWIYGERVGKITEHPAFRNTARMIARLYDALHSDHAGGRNVLTCATEWGGFTHRYFVAPRTVDEQVAGRDAIAAWSRLTYGWLGRSPDYKAAFLATLGANAEFYAPYQENARRWYRHSQERMPFINHAIIHPPVDRGMAPGSPGGPADICIRVIKETDAGIRVSGAKVVATGSALTHYTFVAHHGLIPVQDKNFALVFMVPTSAPGVKLIGRVSNEHRAAVRRSPAAPPRSPARWWSPPRLRRVSATAFPRPPRPTVGQSSRRTRPACGIASACPAYARRLAVKETSSISDRNMMDPDLLPGSTCPR